MNFGSWGLHRCSRHSSFFFCGLSKEEALSVIIMAGMVCTTGARCKSRRRQRNSLAAVQPEESRKFTTQQKRKARTHTHNRTIIFKKKLTILQHYMDYVVCAWKWV